MIQIDNYFSRSDQLLQKLVTIVLENQKAFHVPYKYLFALLSHN